MIWKKEFKIEDLNQTNETYNNPFDLDFIEKGANFLTCKMPVNKNTIQPMGLLHGGASVYLAETVGSLAGQMCVEGNSSYVVGLDINANHLRGVRNGFVYAKAMPIHIGGKTHVWSIEITNEDKKMVCICRLTLAVIRA